jgi:nucleoside-diphosphate-sugar epimerase
LALGTSAGFSPTETEVHAQRGRKILVTGATGFIGGEIAARTSECGHTVWALIRANNDTHAAERLRQRFARSGRNGIENVTPVCGDISKPFCGVSDADLARLRRECDLIIHAAGETSFKNAKECNETNVNGASEIIQLAKTWPTSPRIFFISTASVCCGPAHADIAENAEPTGYANGYTLSKRHAEWVMLESGLDVTILRPSIVLSRGIQDRPFARSILWVIPAIIQLVEVAVDGSARVDLVPVDYVAAAVERLANKDSLQYRRYHLSAGPQASTTCCEVREVARRVYPDASRVRFRGDAAVRESACSNGGRRALLRAVEYYKPFINADVTYLNDRLAQELGEETPVCPNATEYLAELIAQIGVEEALDESLRP